MLKEDYWQPKPKVPGAQMSSGIKMATTACHVRLFVAASKGIGYVCTARQ